MTTPPLKTLEDALMEFLPSLQAEAKQRAQEELPRLIRWCGRQRPCDDLSAPEVEQYAQRMLAANGTPDAVARLEQVRAFLGHLHRRGYTRPNLASHVRLRRAGGARKTTQESHRRRASANRVQLTAEGYARLKEELEGLIAQRAAVAEEIRRAAADKDVRENAPLEAARERQGMLEARIRELESTLGSATVLQDGGAEVEQKSRRVTLGSRVVLRDLTTGREMTYILVGPSEANPLEGKLSAESPVGKALLDRSEGEQVEVVAPRGVTTYLVAKLQ